MRSSSFNSDMSSGESISRLEQSQTEINNNFIFNYQERDVHRNNLRSFSGHTNLSVIRGLQNHRRHLPSQEMSQHLRMRQVPLGSFIPSSEEHKTPVIEISPPIEECPDLNISDEGVSSSQEPALHIFNEDFRGLESSAEEPLFEYTPPRTPRPPTSSSESSDTDLELATPTMLANSPFPEVMGGSPFLGDLANSINPERWSNSPPPEVVPDSPLQNPRALLPSSFAVRQTDIGGFTAHIECTPEIALELISRNFDTMIQNSMELTSVFYDRNGFTIESPFEGVVLLAALQLRLRFMMLSVGNVQLVQRNFDSEDLVDVEFNDNVEFKGDAVCSICLCEISPGDLVRRTPCLHLFHSECIKGWLKNRRVCPIDKYFLN